MRTYARLLHVGLVMLSPGLLSVAIAGCGSAARETDVPDENLGQDIVKLADAIELEDWPAANQQATDIARRLDNIKRPMHLMQFRSGMRGALGVGENPGEIKPDGIEMKIRSLAKEPLSMEQFKAEAEPLARMAYIAAAIGEVVEAKPPDSDDGDQKREEWVRWAREMKEAAIELAAAAKADDPQQLQTKAGKLYGKCNGCHLRFPTY